MEASMHGPYDKSPEGEPNIYRSFNMKLVALPLLLAIALIGYVVSHTGVVKWMADGVQAEFVGMDAGPEGAKQVARPSDQARNTAR
jgi:hypothetical protein